MISNLGDIVIRITELILLVAIVVGLQSLIIRKKDRLLARDWFLTTMLGLLIAIPLSPAGLVCSSAAIFLAPMGKIYLMCAWGSPILIGGMIIGVIQTRLLDEDIRPAYLVTACVSSLALGLGIGAIGLYSIQVTGEAIIPGIVLVYGLATSIVLFVYYR